MNEYLKKVYIPTSGGKVLIIDKITADGLPSAVFERYCILGSYEQVFRSRRVGEVVYLIGKPRAGFNYKESVFFQTELPELTRPHGTVTKIVAIDAINLENKRVIWEPTDGHWGMGGANEKDTPADIFVAPTSGCGGGKVKRAGVASCPLPGAKSNAKAGKEGQRRVKLRQDRDRAGRRERPIRAPMLRQLVRRLVRRRNSQSQRRNGRSRLQRPLVGSVKEKGGS